MDLTQEPEEAHQATKAWVKGNYEAGRKLYVVCVEKARRPGEHLPPSFYLCEWARMEGTINNRVAFESLYQQAFALEPDAPFIRLCYARDLWTEFKDGPACSKEIQKLESLLSSDHWNKSNDLSPLAYAQKIETLRAWVRGEPGGQLWP